MGRPQGRRRSREASIAPGTVQRPPCLQRRRFHLAQAFRLTTSRGCEMNCSTRGRNARSPIWGNEATASGLGAASCLRRVRASLLACLETGNQFHFGAFGRSPGDDEDWNGNGVERFTRVACFPAPGQVANGAGGVANTV